MCVNLTNPLEEATVISVLQMRNFKFKEVKELAQGYTGSQHQRQLFTLNLPNIKVHAFVLKELHSSLRVWKSDCPLRVKFKNQHVT